MCLMVAVVAVILSCWIIYENRQLEKEGAADENEIDTDVTEAEGYHVRHKIVW